MDSGRHLTNLRSTLSAFSYLDQDTIGYMMNRVKIESVKKHHIFFSAGEIATKLYFISEGLVMQRYADYDREKATSFHFEKDFVTVYESFLKQTPAEFHLHPLENTVLLFWDKKDYDDFITTHPHALLASMSFTQELFFREYNIKSRLLAYTPEKLYQYFVHHEPRLIQRVPLIYLAEYMGITNEYLSRLRKKLKSS